MTSAACAAGRGPSACAPERLGPKNFVSGQSPDEAAVQLPQAGHAQFWHAPRLWQRLADAVCGTGNVSDATIRGWAITLATAQMLRMHPPALPQVRATLQHASLNDRRGCTTIPSRRELHRTDLLFPSQQHASQAAHAVQRWATACRTSWTRCTACLRRGGKCESNRVICGPTSRQQVVPLCHRRPAAFTAAVSRDAWAQCGRAAPGCA